MIYQNSLLHDDDYIEIVFEYKKSYIHIRGVRKKDNRTVASTLLIIKENYKRYEVYSNIFCI